MKAKKPISYYIGTAMMLMGVLIIGYIYLPIVIMYIFPDDVPTSPQTKNFVISIPSIHASAPIIQNVDPFNPSEYNEKLKNGIAHAKGSSMPDQDGGIYLFAHSSDAPWNITRYNTAFFRLHEMELGDSILLFYNGLMYTYSVTDKITVNPDQVEYLTDQKHDLILQTCTPIGTAFQRMLIIAKKV